MKLLDLLKENLDTNGTDYSAVRKSIVKKLQDNANEEEGMFEEINKGFRLEPIGFDPELNKYSSRVIQMPVTRLIDQLDQALKDVDPVLKNYPKHTDKFKDLKSDLRALVKELRKFSNDNELE
jgi:predicted  nucleic acid-binding Zn-ribbon protein